MSTTTTAFYDKAREARQYAEAMTVALREAQEATTPSTAAQDHSWVSYCWLQAARWAISPSQSAPLQAAGWAALARQESALAPARAALRAAKAAARAAARAAETPTP